MKIVQCNSKGTIIIPKKIRDELKIKKDSAFWIYVSNGKIILKRVEQHLPQINLPKCRGFHKNG